MRLLATSDWHLDGITAGFDRLAELEAYADAVALAAEREKVDLVVHLGDVMDPGHLHESKLQRVLLTAAARLTTAAKLGSVWLAGNHDVMDTAEPTSTMSPLATVAHCWHRPDKQDPRLTVLEEPKMVLYREGLALLCLPYTSRAFMATPGYQKAMKSALDAAARVKRAGTSKLVVLSHLSLPGMHPEAAGEPRGREVPFPVEEVRALQPDLILQGHYHARQVVQLGGGLEVQVVGAPLRFNFGERADGERGYLLVDL
jgi:DNA repair exonuclease SbcCD nuclease subunit